MPKAAGAREFDRLEAMDVRPDWILPEGPAAGSLRDRVLARRGLTGDRDRQLFAGPTPPLSLLREPASLPGADAVAAALDAWLKDGLSIAVYGDYDADGICAAAIVARVLRLFGGNPRTFVPHRVDEGYGLHADALRELHAQGVRAVVTVDCGISSFAEAEVAEQLGLRLAITDHHRPTFDDAGVARTPRAEAVAHPSLGGCPFEAISGSVVALKVAKRLIRLRVGERPPALILQWVADVGVPLAAMGLVPDVMPLLDENRVLVANALRRLPSCPLPGVQALLRAARSNGEALDARTLSHAIGPRLNALGRIDDATGALRLLETDDPAEARTIARRIEATNEERKTRQDELIALAEARARELGLDAPDRVSVVMADASWHPGLLGLAAGRLVDRLHRPVVLFGGEGQHMKASGRAPLGIDLHDCMKACGEHLVKFGGHAAAAGGSIEPAKVAAFAEAFERAVRQRIEGGARASALQIDASMPAWAAMDALPEIQSMQPYGKDFREPLIHCGELRVRSARTMGGGEHLKVQAQEAGSLRTVSLLMWRQGRRAGEFRTGRLLEVVGTPRSNPQWGDDFEVTDFRFVD